MCLNDVKKDIRVSNKEILTFLESHEPCQHGEIEHEDNTNQLKLIQTKNAVNRMEKVFESHLVTGDTSDKFGGSLFPWEFGDYGYVRFVNADLQLLIQFKSTA